MTNLKELLRNCLFGTVSSGLMAVDAGLALLRVVAGLMMALGHGIPKVPSHERFVGMVSALGFPLPTALTWMAGISELAGRLLLAPGLLTRPWSLLIAVTMTVAAFMAHAGDPFFSPGGPSQETAVLYLTVAFTFLIIGGGRFSIDRLFRRSKVSPQNAEPSQ